MSFALRNYSGLLVAALGILAFALLGRSEVIGIARVPIAWLLFLGVPGWLGCRCFASSDDGLALDRWGLSLFAGWVLVLLVFGLAAALGLPTRSFLWLWGGACLALAVIGSRTLSTRPRFRCGGWGLAAVLLGCVLFLARTPPELSVESDLAAHLGGVHDSIDQGRWLPLDHSVREDELLRDPRFGLLHGLHAAMSEHLHIDPVRELQWSAPFFAAVFILGHAALFLAMGLPSAIAFAAALFYAWGAGGGAPLGWWAGFYPAQVGLGICAACVAVGLQSVSEQRLGLPLRLWLAGAGVGLSALVHPFAWWAWMLIAAHAACLTIFRSEMRGWLSPLTRFALPAAVLGMMALLPLLLQRAPELGAQQEAVGILRMGSRFFTMDPFVVARFGGWLSLLAAPALLLASNGSWRRDPRIWLGLAAALPVWTIALNPVIQPLVFAKVGYLSERLGQMAWIPALGLVLIFVRGAGSSHPRPRAVWTMALAAAVLFLGTPHAIGSALRSPYQEGTEETKLQKLHASLTNLGLERAVCDPALAYMMRGVNGGPALVLPVEHCSPLDELARQSLGEYRSLLSPGVRIDGLGVRLRQMGADALVVDDAIQSRYRYPVFGFVPSNARQEDLAHRLDGAGVQPDIRLGSIRVYGVPALLRIAAGSDSTVALSISCDEVRSIPLRGQAVTLIAMDPSPQRVGPGEDLELRVCYEFVGGPSDWESVHLRFEGPMPILPGWVQPFSKLYRKVFVERSGRSRARFMYSWIPLDGYSARSSHDPAQNEEIRRIRIPEGLVPGEYRLQPSIRRDSWRPVRELRDYLSDDDSWTAPDWSTIRIEEGGEGS